MVAHGSITVPSAVTGSVGKYNSPYKGVSTSLSSMGSSSVTTENTTYYANYSKEVTIYYPTSTSELSSGKFYRNEWFTSTSATSQVIGSSNTATSDITTISGILGTFKGLTSSANTTSYSTVASSAASSAATLYAVSTSSVEATFYYNSNTTSGSLTVSTAKASGTRTNYCASTSSATVAHGSITVPSAVTGSVGKYNSTYKGVSTSLSSMGASSTTTANTTYYANYSKAVTIYYPISTSAVSSGTFYRNEWFTSASATSQVIGSSNTATSNITTISGMLGTFKGLASSANTTSYSAVSSSAASSTTTFYAVSTSSVEATFYYNSNTTSGSLTVSTATSSGTRTNYCASTSAATVAHGSITVPSAVTGSVGKYNSTYKGVSTSLSSMGASSTTTANTTYYANYSKAVTIYYPTSTSAVSSGTFYRNEYFTSTSATSQAIGSSNTATSNITTISGILGTFKGLTSSANTTSYSTVASSAASSAATLYAVSTSSVEATFYYNSNTTSGSLTVSTAKASGTRTNYCASTSAATVAHGSITVPSAVTESVGQYNNAYVGIATGLNTMSSGGASPTTANTTYYAVYRSNVTIYRPTSASVASSITAYRNSYFTSNSAMSTVLSSTNTGTSSMSSVSGIYGTLKGFGSVNTSTVTYSSIDALLKSNTTTTYAISTSSITISYDANGGSGAPSNQNTTRTIYCTSTSAATTTGDTTISSTKPIKTGYTFSKWNTKSDGSGTNYSSGTSYNIASSTTLYAIYTINSYTVNVTVQNGTVDTTSKSITYGSNGTFTISPSTGYGSPTVSCTNSQSANISGTTLTVSNVTNSSTCTVTYKANTYTVTLNNSSATTSGTTSVTATYNSSSISPSTITLPKRSYTVSGFGTSDSRNSTGASISSTSSLTSTYTFNGWYDGTSGGNMVINNNSTPAYATSAPGYTDSSGRWIKAGTATLYAQWTSKSVTLPTITKTGYTCGWTTSETGTTVSYASGATYTPSANTPMYAVCEISKYAVNVVVQNGTVDSASKSIAHGSNGTFTISPSTGYESPTVSCTNSKSASISGTTLTVSNVTSATTCTVTYTAKSYDLTLTNKDATTSGTTSATATYDSSSISPSSITVPKRAYTVSGFNTYSMNAYGAKVSSKATLTSNYTFNGWYTAESGGSRVINDSSTPAYIASVSGYTDGNGRWKRDEATTLYAQWTPVAVTLPTITRSGYTCGWSTSFYNSSIMYASGAEFIPTANTTLYGVCQTGSSTSSYTVNVVVQNGTVDSASKTVNSGSNGSFTLTPSAGYSSPSVSCTNSQRGYIYGSTLTVYNVTNNTTCTVTYSSSDYTITLTNTDATTTGTTSVTAAYNSSTISPSTITLPKRAYTVSGFGTADSRNSTGASISSTSTLTSTYTFNGWYTATSGGSKVINNSSTPAYVASVSGYTDSSSRWIKEGGATLYAQWSSQSVTLPTITKSGYTCGWTTSETGTTVSYASGATYTPTENTPMYAVCKSNTTTTTYTVNVVVQNGTVSPSSRDIESGSNGTFTISPSTGYGSPTVSCTNSQNGSISGNTLTVSNVTNNSTCTVTYKASTYTVTLNNSSATKAGTTSVTATYNSSSISPSTITLPKRVYTVSDFGTSSSRNSNGATISSTSTLTANYTFNGWYTATSGGSKVISNSSTPAYVASVSGYTDSSNRWIKAGGATLYAQWSSASVTLPTITKSGYTCGWTTSSSGTTVSYSSGATYTPTENTTMYAVCVSNTSSYTVNVVVQNGTVDSASKSVNSGSNGTFTISPSTGYGSPTVSCTNSQSASISGTTLTVSSVTSSTTCTVTYKANTYTVAYSMNGASSKSSETWTYDTAKNVANPSKTFTVNITNSASGTLSATSASKAQTFAGWTADSNLNTSTALYGTNSSPSTSWTNGSTKVTATYFKNLRSTSGTVTLTANWTPVAVTLPTVTKTGYTCGYSTSSSGSISYSSGASYTPSATGSSATLYTVCTAKTKSISFSIAYDTSTYSGPSSSYSTSSYQTLSKSSTTLNYGASESITASPAYPDDRYTGSVSCTNGITATLTAGSGTTDRTDTIKVTNNSDSTTSSVCTIKYTPKWEGIAYGSYTAGNNLTYAGSTWAIKADNGANTGLVLNATAGTGAYKSDIQSNLGNSSVNTDVSGGGIVAQSSGAYVSTDGGISTNLTSSSYFTDSSHFYNKTARNYYYITSNDYIQGMTVKRDGNDVTGATKHTYDTVLTTYSSASNSIISITPSSITAGSSSVTPYSVSNGVVTFKNASSSSSTTDNYYSQRGRTNTFTSGDETKVNTSYENFKWDNSASAWNITASGEHKIVSRHDYYICGGSNHGKLAVFYRYNTSQFKYGNNGTGTGWSSDLTAKFDPDVAQAYSYVSSSKYMIGTFAGFADTGTGEDCAAGVDTTKCSTTTINGYTRQYRKYHLDTYENNSYCYQLTTYTASDVTDTIYYRPYLIVRER